MNAPATRRKALLLAIQLPRMTDAELEGSLAELGRLVHTLGYEVVGLQRQKRKTTEGALLVGEGKLRELAKWTGGPGFVPSPVLKKKSKAALKFADAEADVEDDDTEVEVGTEADSEIEVEDESESKPPEGTRAEVIVVDCELSPSQLRNLEAATGVDVLDRTGVIIEIFSRHARTRAARLQVEIARLNYLAPRIRETGASSERSGGGVGGKGSGESSQELDRRHIRDRIKELKGELESVQDEGAVRRQRRQGENSVALVGYTNAGKSSLMRAMTGSEVLVADKLFATLDTTVRPLHPESVPRVLLSDTVGFIKKLPHDLVASFRSTLEEALNADLLFFVVDASDPAFRDQLAVTKQVLGEIGATELPSRMILNKRDRLSEDEQKKLLAEFPDAILISTRNPEDLSRLREDLVKFFERDMVDADVLVPYSTKGAIGEIRRLMRVIAESYNEAGVTLKVRATESDLKKVRSRFNL